MWEVQGVRGMPEAGDYGGVGEVVYGVREAAGEGSRE